MNRSDVRYVVPISGKDSLTTAIVTRLIYPEKPLEYIFNDVGADLPEVGEWLSKVEAYLGQPIERIGSNLLNLIPQLGFLPSPKSRYCTRITKIQAMEQWLGDSHTMLFLGIRADEQRIGYRGEKKGNVFPAYPLQRLGLTLEDVYRVVDAVNLTPPTFFWAQLYEQVKALVSEEWILGLERWEFNMLFAWRSRPNCFMCFYMRLYEYIGLYQHYPHLFEIACQLEENIGGDGYTWHKGFTLRSLLERAEAIIARRAFEVASYIAKKHGVVLNKQGGGQLQMFFEYPDELKIVSCGLLCGK